MIFLFNYFGVVILHKNAVSQFCGYTLNFPKYRFVGICIQPYTDMVSQAQNILNLDLSNQFSFNDFESSSKDWVLTFLNKTIIVDEKVKIIEGFSNLFTNDIEEILNSN